MLGCTYTSLESDLKHLTKTIQTWLKACTTNHELCELATSANALPTRLIDVGPLDCSRPPRLHVPTRLTQTSSVRIDYVALSYCWGSTQRLALTTNDNIAERLTEISMDSLPKTIRDAILITRELGIEYLWVDALCIIQPTEGNFNDWDIESLCMGTYYQNALLTFAAALGNDSADGLWREKSVPQSGRYTPRLSSIQPFFTFRSQKEYTTRVTRTDPNWRRAVQRSTLRGRGWALQELILSTRTIYWTPDGIYWDCCNSIASESKPVTLSFNEFDQLDPVRETRLRFAHARLLPNADSVLERWYGIVAHYSCLDLSYATDTLPAVSGIAKTVQKFTNEEIQYAAGIWINSRDSRVSWFDLAWRVAITISHSPAAVKREKSSSYIAPSWSWASAGAPIIYSDRGSQQGGLSRGTADEFFEIIDIKLQHLGKDTMGQLRNGIMRLRGTMPMDFSVTLEPTSDPRHWFEQLEGCKQPGLVRINERQLFQRTNFYFDEERVQQEGLVKVICLLLGCLGSWQYCILLEAVPGFIFRFRRIGLLQRHVLNLFGSTKVMDIEVV